jgi:hypothetical protein
MDMDGRGQMRTKAAKVEVKGKVVSLLNQLSTMP